MSAPTTSQYLVLALDAGISAERRLIFGEGFGVNDGGANADYSVSVASRVLDRVVASLTAVSTLTATMYGTILAPNLLSTNGAVQLLVFGSLGNTDGANPSLSIEINLGATTMYNDVLVISDAAAIRAYFIKLLLAAENATNAQVLSGTIYIGDSVSGAVGLGNLLVDEILTTAPIQGTAAENGTTSLTFNLTIRWQAASGTRTFTRRTAYLRRV